MICEACKKEFQTLVSIDGIEDINGENAWNYCWPCWEKWNKRWNTTIPQAWHLGHIVGDDMRIWVDFNKAHDSIIIIKEEDSG